MSWGMGAGSAAGQWPAAAAAAMHPAAATGQWAAPAVNTAAAAGQWAAPAVNSAAAAGQWAARALNPAAAGQWAAPVNPAAAAQWGGAVPAAGQWGAPAAAPPAGYAPDAWNAMQQQQQQQWQQWAQWQQQYVQWQAQYGDKFTQQMQMRNAQAASVPPLPAAAAPAAPPLPKEQPPPPPPHENNQPLYGQAQAAAAAAAPPPAQPAYGATAAGTTSGSDSAPAINTEALKKLAEEERLFDIQFKKWEDEIEKWKRENVNHPDKQAYKEYEQKFEACRVQLMERRQQMNARKARLLGTPPAAPAPAANVQTPAPAAADTTGNVTNVQGQSNTQHYPNSTQPSQHMPKNNKLQNQPQSQPQSNQWENYPNQGSQAPYGTPATATNFQGNQNNTQPAPANTNTIPQDSYGAYGSMDTNSQDSKPFLPSSAGSKGIPGLDLVTDEKPAASAAPVVDITGDAPQGPDYSNISKGINNILGDAKIMNILNMVREPAPVPATSAPATAAVSAAPAVAPVPAPAAAATPAYALPQPSQPAATNQMAPDYQNMLNNYQNAAMNQNQWTWNYYTQQYENTNMQYNAPPPNAAMQQTNQQNQYYNQYGAYNQNMAPNAMQPTMGMNPNVPQPAMAANGYTHTPMMGLGQTMPVMNQMNGPPPLMGLNPMGGPQKLANGPESAKPDDPWADEPLFTPGIIVEYDHKPLRLKARAFIEPAHTFDYNHISKEEEKVTHKDFEREAEDLFLNFPKRPPVNEREYQSNPDWNFERRGQARVPPLMDFGDRRPPRMSNPSRWEPVHKPEEHRMELPRDYNSRDNNIRRDDYSRDDFSKDDFSRDDFSRGNDRNNRHRGRSNSREQSQSRKRGRSKESDAKSKSDNSKKPKEAPKKDPPRVIMIDDILEPPGRDIRPDKIVIILRGPPGSGKSHLAKLIRDREAEFGGAARIMSIDDYFMQESEVEEIDPNTGKMVKKPTLKYEYDAKSEETYMNSLKRAFKRSITDGYFNFLIYDAVNDQLKSYADIWNFARQNNFQVYVVTMELDPVLCYSRCTHGRSLDDIQVVVARWFTTPAHHLQLDCSSLLQPRIDDVTMEDAVHEPETEVDANETSFTSKWEKMDDAQQLARLDGTSKPLRPASLTMHDYLQLDDWQPSTTCKPGKKTVRWADIEERRAQERARAVGFVVGGTDWGRMVDPTRAQQALAQTKYIERVARK